MKATVGNVSGAARVRVIPPLPWSFDFEGMKAAPMWWNSNLKGVPRDLDGSGVLVRPRDETVGRRTKFMMGRPEWSDYTIEADVRGMEMRRQRGDVVLGDARLSNSLFVSSVSDDGLRDGAREARDALLVDVDPENAVAEARQLRRHGAAEGPEPDHLARFGIDTSPAGSEPRPNASSRPPNPCSIGCRESTAPARRRRLRAAGCAHRSPGQSPERR